MTTERESERRTQTARNGLAGSLARASGVIGVAKVDDVVIVGFVNEQRGILGGDPLDEARFGRLKEDLTPPSAVVSAASVPSQAIAAAVTLRGYMTSQQRSDADVGARSLFDVSMKLAANARLATELGRRELTRLGLELLAGNACPLCEHLWPAGDLDSRLSARLAVADEAGALHTQRRDATMSLVSLTRSIRTRLTSLVEIARQHLDREELDPLLSWGDGMEVLEHALESANGGLAAPGPPDIVETLLPSWAPSLIDALVARWQSEERASGPSEEQLAWDALTRLDEHLGRVEAERKDLQKAESVQGRATQLLAAFQSARESVLNALYESVKGRFVQLYRELHGDDEPEFNAVMQPSQTGLDFKVDFHGRGTHPPHALHSEGHQDSMGICLYFALAERLTGGFIDLVILDDVMMSVDADHRRDLCRLLSTAFSEKQLIITTHDRTWAHQLRSERVVTGRDSVQFYGWDVSTGPRVAFAGDVWEEIDKDLVAGQVSTAAHRLRRSSEEYFASVCDALQAPVAYKLDGRHELGDFAPAAIERIRKLLRQAKNAAGTWDQREFRERLGEIDSTHGQVFARSNAEQWPINATVHYNSWENLSAADFHPVLEAFQDLFDVFRCTSCGTLLRVTWVGGSPATVRCSCGAVDWNLQEKQRGA